MTEQDQSSFYDLLDKYNEGVEPIENWLTEDLVRVVELIDAELQRRDFEREFRSPFDYVETDDDAY